MMDDEEDVSYHPNPYVMNRQNLPVKNVHFPRSVKNSYAGDGTDDDDDDEENGDKGMNNEQDDDDDDDDEEEEEEDDGGDDGNGVQRIRNDDYEYDDYSDLQRHPKKKRLKTLISSYEFAPRVAAPSVVPLAPTKPSYGGRNPLTDWTEHETFILLDAWGERFLKQGRKSLRSEEWQEVAEKVSQESKMERTDTQCRNRLDTLKKKYKKEKMKIEESNNTNNNSTCNKGFASEWVYFKKMDALLSAPLNRAGLSCGVDSGEFVFMNPEDYLSRSNHLDEMRDSPGNSASTEHEKDETPKDVRPKRARNGKSKPFKLLADSFRKFSDIYEKIEHNKREQMAELEKMRMDFHRDLELQKREILESARAEIARIRQGDVYEDDDDDNDDDDDDVVCGENVSG
ncbi:hypothetical protein OROHE_005850 [Orobanche hederae]